MRIQVDSKLDGDFFHVNNITDSVLYLVSDGRLDTLSGKDYIVVKGNQTVMGDLVGSRIVTRKKELIFCFKFPRSKLPKLIQSGIKTDNHYF